MTARKRPRVRICEESGKHGAHDLYQLESMAKVSVMNSNRAGEVVPPLYGYRCGSCGLLHLTRRGQWEGVWNHLIYAPPLELQRWAAGRLPE